MNIKTKITDFFVNFEWEIEIIPPKAIIYDLPLGLNNESIYLKNTTLPSLNTELLVNSYYKGDNNFIAKADFDTDNFVLGIRADSLMLNYDFVIKWNKLKYNDTKSKIKLLNYPNTYFGKIITKLKNNKSKQYVYQIEYKKVYPNMIGDLQLTSEDIEIGEFDTTFSFKDTEHKNLFDL